jgi:hypothetical protein
VVDRFRLMRIGRGNPADVQRVAQPLVERRRERRVPGRNLRQPPHGCDVKVRSVGPVRQTPGRQPFERGIERCVTYRAAGTCCQRTASRLADVRHGWQS